MTANHLLTLITQSITVLIALLTLTDLARYRDRPHLDVALMFADLGLTVAVQWLEQIVVPAPSWLAMAEALLLIAHPYFLLRLVEHLRPVSSRMLGLALGGLVGSWLALIALPAPLPVPVTLLLVAYFVSIESYSAGAMLLGARQTRGVSRGRLLLAASGSGFFTLLILSGALATLAPDARSVVAAGGQLLSLLVALTYYLGFSPPNWLRRYWQQAELHAFLRSASGHWTDQDPDQALLRLCAAAERAAGGFASLAALAGPAGEELLGHVSSQPEKVSTSLQLRHPALRKAWRTRRPVMIDLSRQRQNALASATGAGAVLAVPIAAQKRTWGLLLVFLWQVPLFPVDDLALLTLFSEQAAMALSYVEMLGQQRSLIDQLKRGAVRLETMNEVNRAILAAQSPQEIASVALASLREFVPCRRAHVLLYDIERKQAQVLASHSDDESGFPPGSGLAFADLGVGAGGPVQYENHYLEDIEGRADLPPLLAQARAQGVRSVLNTSLVADSQVVGELALASNRPAAFTPEQREVARQVADSLAVAIHNARLFEEVEQGRRHLQDLSRRLVRAQEDERRAIARELHDEAGQGLTSVMVGLGLAQRELIDPPAARARLEELKQITGQVMSGLHDLAADLRPAGLDRLGLIPALRQQVNEFAQIHDISVNFDVLNLDPNQRLRPDVEIAIYRLVQEALTNVVRHAEAKHVGVLLYCDDGHIKAMIEDDGTGFDVAEAMQRGRLGLVGMRERAEMLGGELSIESQRGIGTTVYAEVPMAG